MKKLKAHIVTLPRPFGIPFFGSVALLGSVLAGGNLHSIVPWLGLIAVLLVMAGGHSFNTSLDYAWTKLDEGEVENRSAEKDYTGGQNVLGNKTVSLSEVNMNAVGWYILSLIPILILVIGYHTPWILLPWFLGMLCTFWYSISKFNYTHELALGVSCGPLPVVIGILAVNPHPTMGLIMNGILASLLIAMTFSFMGLALDEWPDAEANLKKGVHSFAFKVWEYTHEQGVIGLASYCWAWVAMTAIFQVFLISIGILAPMTAIAFIPLVILIPMFLMLVGNFRKMMMPVVGLAALYCVLILVGQIIK